ncbi:MAG: class I SAM-dependent methyltransferase [Candidatus Omnitrophica bacterium]|nr:class I SAM-dependent methyltransferase [Candidatus Omnitrophota bacterium]
MGSQATYLKNLQYLSGIDKYNRYIYENICPFLGDSILDVGCGMGNITQYFTDKKRVMGVDSTAEFMDIFRRKCPKAEAILGDINDAHVGRALKNVFIDTIVMTNVLEHIEDDRCVLEKLYKILAPGGKVVLVVPAHKWLFGAADAYDLHFRRYTENEIRQRLSSVGFSMLKSFQYSALGIPWWFINGRILKQGKHDENEGSLINMIVPLVRVVDKMTFNRIGLSIVAVAQKAPAAI